MNQQFDTEEDSINSDEAIKFIECKSLTPNFHIDCNEKDSSVHNRMNAINTLMCKFKESLVSKDEIFTQSSPFKSTNGISSQNGFQQSESPSQTINAEDFTKQDNVHLADSRQRRQNRNSIEQFIGMQIHQNHRKSQTQLSTNMIQTRNAKRQIFVTQIVNDHCEITSFPLPKPQRLSRIIQNKDGLQSQRGSSTSTPRGILKSTSFEVLRIGSRPSTQSLNSSMVRSSSKRVSFEFTSQQIRKMKDNRANSENSKYQRLKTKFKR
ncbi:unnamed protein product (macronuclear) [Paramecium tetraurelia]|uniref:Uncharacterized protein n=1 Tax=Paramecium tetraurelia TaxID=5888 RepID=A0CG21_PARTE|nr:uncharacterized protein GSPATT00038181001 [Paramecium tetraurelia]CAK69738.1 unnamed protein product [Paramecium tetraurelia]|eukprot:XP_001437135.1 hypothetical protein (macronuclear) [Paramecium tetraurelia strain d4-2]